MTVHAAMMHGVERRRLDLRGVVQGVGFRPFAYRLASAEGLSGFVRNTGDGVTLEVEGRPEVVECFIRRLNAELPPNAAIYTRRIVRLAPRGEVGFCVLPSEVNGTPSAFVMPDFATCPDCLREIFDPDDRRFQYPFTTCINCGPRYSILITLPYDRERTTMRGFALCAACQAEYGDPASRRFHAEPIACPECGPQLALWDGTGRTLALRGDALRATADALRRGLIIAVKGLGGFQFIVDAKNEEAVRRLRARKMRPRKPFALMFASPDAARDVAHISAPDAALLASPQSPILLLRAKSDVCLAPSIAPGSPLLGIMGPTTPLHHLLLREFAGPVVATSGNLSGEPIATDENEARARLGGIADFFLVHNRPILHAVDDSVVRAIAGEHVVLRRARGFAPLPISCAAVQAPVLALGGEQKNAVATGFGGQIFLGPHIGDLSAPASRKACERMAEDLTRLHARAPSVVACDVHPDYYTSRFAERFGLPVACVPHHLAHILSGMVDNGLDGPVLGIAWDGTGYGGDGTVWGGEFIRLDEKSFHRFAHLRTFALPGGEAAAREPRRAALGLLYALYGQEAFARRDLAPIAAFLPTEIGVLSAMLGSGLNSPITSSAGRLFDATAAILDFCQRATFEGEAAMAVEFAASRADTPARLPPPVLAGDESGWIVDWRPMFAALVDAAARGTPPQPLALALHQGLAEAIVAVAERAGVARVLLTGGCFQNANLTETVMTKLDAAGFTPFRHRKIPPNDGGLAVGQAFFAARPLKEERC